MAPRRILVIGTSAGGLAALQALLGALPADFAAAILVVMHVGAHPSELPSLLTHTGPLPAAHARDGEPIEPGRIYVAPPDHHMIVQGGRIRLTNGPRENWARPAVDPLFRSAAYAYGNAVIGIILTGALNDGTAGLYEIKAHGGIAIVQDPAEAVESGMPLSAMRNVTVDYCLPLLRIPSLLMRLVSETTVEAARQPATEQERPMTAEYTAERPVRLTCPDCGGALRETRLGTLTQFRCHIGHVYTAEVMAAAQSLALERALETALRSLNERAELCRDMAEKSRLAGQAEAESMWTLAMEEAETRGAALRKIVEQDWSQPAAPAA